jgi:hypothetical protein
MDVGLYEQRRILRVDAAGCLVRPNPRAWAVRIGLPLLRGCAALAGWELPGTAW